MITIVALVFVLAIVILLAVKYQDLKEWYHYKMDVFGYNWCLAHKEGLPIDPKIINAGEWVKIEDDSITISADGIYVFLCRGDNHLLYEIHELYRGSPILSNFQGAKLHFDGWFSVKPLYYYYIPFNNNFRVIF